MAKPRTPERRAQEIFGASLKQLRLAREWSAEQVATALGVTKDSITKYEAGKRGPNILTLLRLAKIFGVSLDRLINGREGPVKLLPIVSTEDVLTPPKPKRSAPKSPSNGKTNPCEPDPIPDPDTTWQI